MTILYLSIFAIWVLSCAVYNYLAPRLPNWMVVIGFVLSIPLINLWWNDPSRESIWIVWLISAYLINIAAYFWLEAWGGGDAKFLFVVLLAVPNIFAYLGLLAGLTLKLIYDLVFVRIEQRRDFPALVYFGAGWLSWYSFIIITQFR